MVICHGGKPDSREFERSKNKTIQYVLINGFPKGTPFKYLEIIVKHAFIFNVVYIYVRKNVFKIAYICSRAG